MDSRACLVLDLFLLQLTTEILNVLILKVGKSCAFETASHKALSLNYTGTCASEHDMIYYNILLFVKYILPLFYLEGKSLPYTFYPHFQLVKCL